MPVVLGLDLENDFVRGSPNFSGREDLARPMGVRLDRGHRVAQGDRGSLGLPEAARLGCWSRPVAIFSLLGREAANNQYRLVAYQSFLDADVDGRSAVPRPSLGVLVGTAVAARWEATQPPSPAVLVAALVGCLKRRQDLHRSSVPRYTVAEAVPVGVAWRVVGDFAVKIYHCARQCVRRAGLVGGCARAAGRGATSQERGANVSMRSSSRRYGRRHRGSF